MKAFTLPTIFTALDRVSGPLNKMGRGMDSFAMRAETGVARADRAFRKFTPGLSSAAKQFISFASTAAAVGAIIGGIGFSAKALMDYETELANLRAVTGASGKDFDLFKIKINEVAVATKKSSVEVTQAFTAIANNQPELLKDANALAAVTKSSIVLAQASKMELQPAGEALTQILNQFGLGAMDAAKTIDILAAGSVAGSSEIRDTADAIQKFGTVAVNAGVKINESVALIELSSKFEKGAEAGTRLRNILITMQTLKVQDPKALKDVARLGINMDIVTNSALPLTTRLKEMAKAGKDSAALFHIFGKENIALAAGILNNADKLDGMTEAVNTAGMASKMAADNNDTLSTALDQASAAWVNMLTSSDKASSGLNAFKEIVKFTSNNLGGIVTILGSVIGVFIAWKTWIVLSRVALIMWRAAANLTFLVQMIKYIAMTRGLTVWQAIAAIATESWTAAFASLSAAMWANPIGVIVLAIIALIAVVVVVIKYWDQWGAALSLFLGPLGLIVSFIQSFRNNWDNIKKAFAEGGILAGIKAIGATIIDVMLYPLQQVLEIIASITGADWAANAAKGLESFRKNSMGVETTIEKEKPESAASEENKQREEKTRNNIQQQNTTLTIQNQTGNKISTQSNNNLIDIKMGSTMKFGMQ